MSNTFVIKYYTGAFTRAGWRSVSVTAKARAISAKMVEVEEVLSVHDADPTDWRASVTGARRQEFSPRSVAAGESGKRKRLSACEVLEVHEDDL